jgi:hypothetical protein
MFITVNLDLTSARQMVKSFRGILRFGAATGRSANQTHNRKMGSMSRPPTDPLITDYWILITDY